MDKPFAWADGSGRWYAEVPDNANAIETAREAIHAELDARGDRGHGYVVLLERAPDYVQAVAIRHGYVVYRETGA